MSLPVFTLSNGQKVKLGKAPARLDPRTLQLAKYIPAATLPPPPSTGNFAQKISAWPMMLNDTLGDCACACAAT